jgi:hypothetical protein
MFEIDFMHWPNSQCLSLFIFKWLFVKISIYHILMVNAIKRLNLSNEKDQTFHMGQTICEITFEIYIYIYIHFWYIILGVIFMQIYSNPSWYTLKFIFKFIIWVIL